MDPQHWKIPLLTNKITFSYLTKQVQDTGVLYIRFCHREMRQHFLESRHKYTRRVVCECGKRFSGGSSSGYRYHRSFFIVFCFCYWWEGSGFVPGLLITFWRYILVFRVRMNNQDHISESLATIFGFYDADLGSVWEKNWIRDKHPGSTTLLFTLKRPISGILMWGSRNTVLFRFFSTISKPY